jgi:hypothetical protein
MEVHIRESLQEGADEPTGRNAVSNGAPFPLKLH